jgi:hypothetical protein
VEAKMISEGWTTNGSRMTTHQLRNAYKNSEMAKLDRMELELKKSRFNNNSNMPFSESRAVQPGRAQPFSTTIAAEKKRNLWAGAESSNDNHRTNMSGSGSSGGGLGSSGGKEEQAMVCELL